MRRGLGNGAEVEPQPSLHTMPLSSHSQVDQLLPTLSVPTGKNYETSAQKAKIANRRAGADQSHQTRRGRQRQSSRVDTSTQSRS